MKRLSRNIDGRGRVARGISGLLFLLGVALLVWDGWPIRGSWLRWGACGVLTLLGTFQLFEAVAGWCVTLALGYKTPM
ncbi:MAG: hypothetical protein KKB50_16610 [Planctomycetes bacterium]|nr:hypothetical protein [Planctomycetota bacterium]